MRRPRSLSLLDSTRSERLRLAASVALAVGAAGAAVALLSTSGWLISRAAQRPQILLLMVAIVAVRAFGIARAALRYAERLASHDHALRRLTRLRARLFARLAPLLPGRIGGSGDMLARFVGDVDAQADLHPRGTIPLLVALAAVPAAGLAAWALLPAEGLVVAVGLAVPALVLPALSGTIASSAARRQAPARARLTNELVQSIDGAAELAIAGRSTERAQLLGEMDAELARLSRIDAVVAAATAALSGVLTGACVVVALAVGISAVSAGTLSGVLLAAVVLLTLATTEVLGPLPEAARRLHSCESAAERLTEVIDGESAPVSDPGQPLDAPTSGPLSMEGVRFRYGPQEQWILDGANLEIEPGEHVALTGSSGIGKTTLAELLVRFQDPSAGAVTLGGVDVRLLAQDELRSNVLLCGQEAHVFNTTVRENLLLANRQAGERDLARALEVVCLTDWVRTLPDGLDTIVGQDGERLSGGQRRRLALARALLSPARFLILDEPTAHLDSALAAEVSSRLLRATAGRGVLTITHEADAELARFDRVLTLTDGVLAAAGGLVANVREDAAAGLPIAV